MVEVHAKGPWSVLPAPFGSIPRLQNTVPVLVFPVFLFPFAAKWIQIALYGNMPYNCGKQGVNDGNCK